ncbi:NAD-dependent epimerase/dehydratase family protein [Candidatus Methylacidithermus pantelleriae]|uniref:GDP-L-fucose synthase n=1 Tax=Candidatus Methylacidithermus pantelleriae TaxID=2744239 RepID=A0A8J2BNP6_9BACT|nr:NAD-dependent epimerase/dehydratase family protein [Candidatus Methylacidithermus pantelleriae]CAF0694387.1 GDP-L-fucose synthase [Candidatus Methylacidithermus pantelleriae]
MRRILVAGAGGFIGHHLVNYLKERGEWVRGVDLKRPEFEPSKADEFWINDLRDEAVCRKVTQGIEEVYQLAADMGGIGYISRYRREVARNNVLINAHVLEAAFHNGVERVFFSSSACVYPAYRQREEDIRPLKEEDAYPAEPEEGYGWEKLFSEKLYQYYGEETELKIRVARFHNVFGPLGTYEGGREKAPAALCRKVAMAEPRGVVEVWGDGKQTRSFLYVDDCVEGIVRIMRSQWQEPINLGSDRMVCIAELAKMVADISGKEVKLVFEADKPQGVRGRNSDNSRLRAVLGWEPTTRLEVGLEKTYRWIYAELSRRGLAR